MKCRTCQRADYAEQHGTLNADRRGLGCFPVPEVHWEECPGCGSRMLPLATIARIDEAAAEMRISLLLDQPVSAFIPEKEAARLLGISRAAVQKSKSIQRLVYSIDRFGHREFHRQSVMEFKRTGDGRFDLIRFGSFGPCTAAPPIPAGEQRLRIPDWPPRIPITERREYAYV